MIRLGTYRKIVESSNTYNAQCCMYIDKMINESLNSDSNYLITEGVSSKIAKGLYNLSKSAFSKLFRKNSKAISSASKPLFKKATQAAAKGDKAAAEAAIKKGKIARLLSFVKKHPIITGVGAVGAYSVANNVANRMISTPTNSSQDIDTSKLAGFKSGINPLRQYDNKLPGYKEQQNQNTSNGNQQNANSSSFADNINSFGKTIANGIDAFGDSTSSGINTTSDALTGRYK